MPLLPKLTGAGGMVPCLPPLPTPLPIPPTWAPMIIRTDTARAPDPDIYDPYAARRRAAASCLLRLGQQQQLLKQALDPLLPYYHIS